MLDKPVGEDVAAVAGRKVSVKKWGTRWMSLSSTDLVVFPNGGGRAILSLKRSDLLRCGDVVHADSSKETIRSDGRQ